jgi:hypothetical protein
VPGSQQSPTCANRHKQASRAIDRAHRDHRTLQPRARISATRRRRVAQRAVRVRALAGRGELPRPGANQVFARVVLELGGHLEVVLPAADYRERKVRPDNHEEFETLIGQATTVRVLPFDSSNRDAYAAADEDVLGGADALVAVWDGAPPDGKGGTGDTVEAARRRGMPVVVVWPDGAQRSRGWKTGAISLQKPGRSRSGHFGALVGHAHDREAPRGLVLQPDCRGHGRSTVCDHDFGAFPDGSRRLSRRSDDLASPAQGAGRSAPPDTATGPAGRHSRNTTVALLAVRPEPSLHPARLGDHEGRDALPHLAVTWSIERAGTQGDRAGLPARCGSDAGASAAWMSRASHALGLPPRLRSGKSTERRRHRSAQARNFLIVPSATHMRYWRRNHSPSGAVDATRSSITAVMIARASRP